MTKIKIDLEELMLSFGFDDEELATEYLDRETGEIINIPRNVMRVAEGKLEEIHLSDWEVELLSEAEAILEDCDDKYLAVPSIEDSYFYNAMVEFTEEMIDNHIIKEKLRRILGSRNPMREFKSTISNYEQLQDLWYEYEDKKTKEYIMKWLKDNEIEGF